MTHEEFARQVGEMLRGLAADIECGRVVAQAREEGPYKAALGTPRTAHKYFTLVYSVAGGESPAGRAAAGGLQNTPPLSGGEMHAGIVELVEEELSSTVKTVSQISELLKLQGVADTWLVFGRLEGVRSELELAQKDVKEMCAIGNCSPP